MKEKKSFSFRATDLIRLSFVLVIVLAIWIPMHVAAEKERYWTEYYTWLDAYEKEIEEDWREWQAMSADEKFVWLIQDMNKEPGTIQDVQIDNANNVIYVYVSGLPKDRMPEDAWDAYVNYEIWMANFAIQNNVEKKVLLIGRVSESSNMWAIDEAGNIIEF